MATTKNIQSVERAFSILELFQRNHGDPLSLKAIAEQLDLNKSTAFGLANTLSSLGYLQRDEALGVYSLGLRFLSFPETISRHHLIRQTVHPYLAELSRRYGETAHCAVGKHGKVTYVDKVAAPGSISINSQVGQENWMHCTSVGKCLMAWLPETELEEILEMELPANTKNTITDPQALRSELAKTRACGYARDDEEFALGLSCLAVPVFSASGEAAFSISLAGMTPKIRIAFEKGAVEDMQKMAKEISENVYGYGASEL